MNSDSDVEFDDGDIVNDEKLPKKPVVHIEPGNTYLQPKKPVMAIEPIKIGSCFSGLETMSKALNNCGIPSKLIFAVEKMHSYWNLSGFHTTLSLQCLKPLPHLKRPFRVLTLFSIHPNASS